MLNIQLVGEDENGVYECVDYDACVLCLFNNDVVYVYQRYPKSNRKVWAAEGWSRTRFARGCNYTNSVI